MDLSNSAILACNCSNVIVPLLSDDVVARLLRPPRVRKVDAAAIVASRLRYQLTIYVGSQYGDEGVCDIWSSEPIPSYFPKQWQGRCI